MQAALIGTHRAGPSRRPAAPPLHSPVGAQAAASPVGQHHPSAAGELPLAVTMGDPNGIGLDITLEAWRRRAHVSGLTFAAFGDAEAYRHRADRLGLNIPIRTISSLDEAAAVFDQALPVRSVRTRSAEDGGAVVAAIEDGAAAVARGEALALVTNPITKRSLDLAHLPYPGHTEFLAELAVRLFGGPRPRPVMMLLADELKVVPATVHVPLAAVIAALTRPLLLETIRITNAALVRDFGIARPRIAVAGLNPHAGEKGLLGREEVTLIAPVIAELAAQGLAITGPHSADALFHADARATYDVAIAMYHDQALIPLKTLAFHRGVNVTLGLPFVRTSPDHGTAFDIAGSGKARADSFLAALRLAAELARTRQRAGTTAPP
jgi:4-hydroxythreonine-4-phosphate dehydrogenase